MRSIRTRVPVQPGWQRRTLLFVPMILASVTLNGTARAALMQVNTDATAAASSTDLLQTDLVGTTPASIGAHEGSGTSLGLLADGTALVSVLAQGSPNYDDDPPNAGPGTISPLTLAPDNNETLAFTLDTSTIANGNGYEINQIDFYHGWGDNGRDGMRFTVEYSLVGSAAFTTFGSTTKFDPGSNYGRTRVTDTLGTIASGVDALRFTPFEIDNGFGGLSEIDVFGTAIAIPIPEPSTSALICLGLLPLGFLGWRRRRRTPPYAVAQRFPSHKCQGRDSIIRIRKAPVAFAAAAILCLLIAGPATAAGTFSSQLFTGDADSGVSFLKTYTHAVDLNSNDGGASINGVTFIAGGTSGANYTLANTTGAFQNNATNVTGGAGDMLDDFFFISGTSTAVAELTLTGLTPGERYITTFYNDGFGSAGNRFQNITTSDGGAILFDQNFSGNDNGNLLQYSYTAAAASLTFSFDAVDNGASFHHYGFSNELDPPVVPEPSTFLMAAFGLFSLGFVGWRPRRRSRIERV